MILQAVLLLFRIFKLSCLLVYLVLLVCFHMKLKIFISVSVRNFSRIWIKSGDGCWQDGHFYYIIHTNSWEWEFLRPSDIFFTFFPSTLVYLSYISFTYWVDSPKYILYYLRVQLKLLFSWFLSWSACHLYIGMVLIFMS